MKSNAELYQDVMDKLQFEPSLDATEIAIRAENAVITLEGKVGSLWEKHAAERAAKSVSGVKAVANELQVDLCSSWQKTDTDIAHAAINALTWNVLVPKDCVQVSVDSGIVTLTGSVNWQFQREAAEKAIRRLMGVKSLNNQIMLKTQPQPNDIKERIHKEFQRHAQVDANQVQVQVNGGKVILKGQVGSWIEIDEAKRAAWSVPGVTAVDNQLVIHYSH